MRLEGTMHTNSRPVLGIIGGGQLARMMLQAALSLDIRTHILGLDKDESTQEISTHYEHVPQYTPSGIYQFARHTTHCTFEHELVDPQTIIELERRGISLRPGGATMAIASDKAAQKLFLQAHGFPHPPFSILHSPEELDAHCEGTTGPYVLKAATGGYDGRGIIFADDHDEAQRNLGRERFAMAWTIEPRYRIDAELAVVTVRGADGVVANYDAVETLQRNGICVEVSYPPSVPLELCKEAEEIARSIAEKTGSIGIQAVEFFVVEGRLLVNEMAPRVHNSGHITIDASVTSQFENHVRAVMGLPLGSTRMLSGAVMVNILGHSSGKRTPDLTAMLSIPTARIHLYDKEPKAGRKIGHITALSSKVALAREAALASLRLCYGDDGQTLL